MVEKLSIIFYISSIVINLTAFGIFLSRFTSEKDTSSLGNKVLMVGFVSLSAALILRFISAGKLMAFNPYEVLAAITWFLILEALIVEYWSGVKILGLYISPVATIMLIIGWSQYHTPEVLTGFLRSNWVLTHASLVFISYGAFIIAAGSSIIYLVQEKQIKSRKETKLLKFLPSLGALEAASFRSVAIGFTTLTVALGMGIWYATKYWKVWDITIVSAAGFAWLVFLFYLFARVKLGWVGKKSAYLAIFGFLVILIIHFIVAAYMVNIHIYKGG